MPCAWRCGIASTRDVAPRSGSGALWNTLPQHFRLGSVSQSSTPWCLRVADLCWRFVKGAGLGWLLAVVLGLSSILGEGAASAQPASGPAARHRHRARVAAGHWVSHRRELKRSHPKRRRHPARAAPALAEANSPPEVAFVTLTTAAKGTSFYVDSRCVGTGSTVRQSLPPGYHQVQAVHPSGARWQKHLSFQAGDDRELIIHW